jgi:hypothetical protein
VNADSGDAHFRRILGISGKAGRQEIRQAYRRLVMENHPDRYPAGSKCMQELRVIMLNEAYHALMESMADDGGRRTSGPRSAAEGDRRTGGDVRGRHAAEVPVCAAEERPAKAVGRHKDPAYAYYKQGFLHFSLAVHGIAEMNQKLAAQKLTGFRPYRVTQDLANSLSLLGTAHGYFSRVVEEHAPCVWEADARVKLKRIERFTGLYRKILANLGAKAQ